MDTIKTYNFSVSYGWDKNEATENNRPFATDNEAKKARDLFAALLRKNGYLIRKRSLSGQLRQYWGWQSPCGICCTIYYIDVISAPAMAA
jgi:hypothetical protein